MIAARPHLDLLRLTIRFYHSRWTNARASTSIPTAILLRRQASRNEAQSNGGELRYQHAGLEDPSAQLDKASALPDDSYIDTLPRLWAAKLAATRR